MAPWGGGVQDETTMIQDCTSSTFTNCLRPFKYQRKTNNG